MGLQKTPKPRGGPRGPPPYRHYWRFLETEIVWEPSGDSVEPKETPRDTLEACCRPEGGPAVAAAAAAVAAAAVAAAAASVGAAIAAALLLLGLAAVAAAGPLLHADRGPPGGGPPSGDESFGRVAAAPLLLLLLLLLRHSILSLGPPVAPVDPKTTQTGKAPLILCRVLGAPKGLLRAPWSFEIS